MSAESYLVHISCGIRIYDVVRVRSSIFYNINTYVEKVHVSRSTPAPYTYMLCRNTRCTRMILLLCWFDIKTPYFRCYAIILCYDRHIILCYDILSYYVMICLSYYVMICLSYFVMIDVSYYVMIYLSYYVICLSYFKYYVMIYLSYYVMEIDTSSSKVWNMKYYPQVKIL